MQSKVFDGNLSLLLFRGAQWESTLNFGHDLISGRLVNDSTKKCSIPCLNFAVTGYFAMPWPADNRYLQMFHSKDTSTKS